MYACWRLVELFYLLRRRLGNTHEGGDGTLSIVRGSAIVSLPFASFFTFRRLYCYLGHGSVKSTPNQVLSLPLFLLARSVARHLTRLLPPKLANLHTLSISNLSKSLGSLTTFDIT